MKIKLNVIVSSFLFIALLSAIPFLTSTAGETRKLSEHGIIDAASFSTLQSAFNAVPKTGGLVKLPPGTYEITEPLIVTSEDTRIEGSGTATHIINKNEDGQPAIILRHPDYPDNGSKRNWRVQLANFRISGNPKSGDGILAQGINEILIDNMAIDHNGGNGITLVDCYEDPRICDSILTYNAKVGLNILRGHDIVVNANQFEENQDALHCIDSYNLCMNGNNLDDHLRHGVVIENTYGSVLSGNMIEECQDTAIIMDRDCYGNTVSANVIAHNFGGGVDLRDAWGCTVSANTFTIVPKRAVVVGPDSGRATISGNTFSNAYIGGKVKRDDAATGVVLDHATDVLITGNAFTGLTGKPVERIGECLRIVERDNLTVEKEPQKQQ